MSSVSSLLPTHPGARDRGPSLSQRDFIVSTQVATVSFIIKGSRPSDIVVSNDVCCAVELGFESQRRHEYLQMLVPLRHGDTLNSRRAASPLVRLRKGEERCVALDHPQGFLPQKWSGN
ncbi:hypothetical protein TNCV_3749961 [Trichonephila clavipes]|nr:hypothetical protein TNCV_3749961 [Trichonephila clavipes]